MKKLLLLLALTTAATFGTQAQIQKSLIKSLNLNGANQVALELDGTINFQTSDNAMLRIQTDINLPTGNASLFQALLGSGRYNVALANTNGVAVVTSLAREVLKIGGKDLEEQISYTVFVPNNVEAKVVPHGNGGNPQAAFSAVYRGSAAKADKPVANR